MKLLPITLALLSLATTASAQEEQDKEKAFVSNFEPSIVQTNDDTTTIGLAYDVSYTFMPKKQAPTGAMIQLQPISRFQAVLAASGLITASAKDNPENFLTTTARAEWFHESAGGKNAFTWSVSAGVFGSFETDQSFDNQQAVLGGAASFGALVPQLNSDFLVAIEFGEVEPGEDVARKAALGVTTLKNYDRLSLEANYQFQTGLSLIPDVEFNYRWFRESSAPPAIKAANLDEFDLFTVRVGVLDNFFVAYSDGKLPFDRENDRTFRAGLSYELGEVGRLLSSLGGALQGGSDN